MTRDKVLDSAITLLRQSGLSGAGINEIVRESGAPKGSVYHFFPQGKEQIVGEALDRHSARVVAFLEETLSRPRTAAKKLETLFDAYAARIEEGRYRLGCPLGAVCLDLDSEMEALRSTVAANFDRYVETIARHVDVGSPRENKAFAAFVVTTIQGAFIRCRAERSGKPFRDAGAWLATLATAKS
jgi:TetR/AcrR family transcriptional repressor of lmrAB and yxaGH operons